MEFNEVFSAAVMAMMVAGILAGFVVGLAAAKKKGTPGGDDEAWRMRLALALLIGTTLVLVL